MINLVLFALSTIGLSNILVHGKILDVLMVKDQSIRYWLKKYDKHQMLECYECTGFWSGVICGSIALTYQVFECYQRSGFWTCVVLAAMSPLYLILCGFAGSVLSQTYSDLIFYLRSNITIEVDASE